MYYGVQMFGIRDLCKKNTEKLFGDLQLAGAAHFEPCLALETVGGFEKIIWTLEEFETNMPVLEKSGLTVESCHVFAQNLLLQIPQLNRLAKTYGIRQFVVKSPQELTKESLLQTAYTYMTVADGIAASGAKLVVHNGAAEISTKIEGRTAYEWLLDACLGKVGMQVDVGWLQYGGENVKEFLWRNRERVLSVHYKDFEDFSDSGSQICPGKGALDLDSCFQFARAMGILQIVDQDSFRKDALEEIREALQILDGCAQSRNHTASYLNILDTETGEVKVLRRFDRIIEAPNWLKKENAILYNSEGHIYHYDVESGEEVCIDTGICDNCNNDHVVSADEKWLAVSHGPADGGFVSQVYIIPLEGGEARLVTPNTPSFLHGWSPDGKELAYCAFREHDGKREVDIYTISAEGGEEERITYGGFNDGPEYSPDGKDIWINSTRSGLMQIWKIDRESKEVVQMTDNERNNWFAHVSPDGKKVVYLAYRKGDLKPAEHLPNMQVELWLMDYNGENKRKVISLFGGQGSINVNSWAKDSRHLAFVSYELL